MRTSPTADRLLQDELTPGARRVSDEMTKALDDLRKHQVVVVGDGHDSYLVARARTASATALAAMIRHGSGLICVTVPEARLRQLGIPQMSTNLGDGSPMFHVAVDAAEEIGTGISATDRSRTIRLLADAASRPGSFTRPGHVLPVASAGPNQPPQGADLIAKLAGLVDADLPAAAFCALTSHSDATLIAGHDEAAHIAADLGYSFIRRAEIVEAYYRTV